MVPGCRCWSAFRADRSAQSRLRCYGFETGAQSPDRYRNEAGRLRGFHPHEHAVLAFLAQLQERVTDLGGLGHSLPADVENDVAGLEAMLRRRTAGFDARDDHAGTHRSRHLARRCKREPEMGNIVWTLAVGRL